MIVASFLSPIEDPLTWLLEALHTSLGVPWAWAIVALTVLVRMALVPLTIRQIHSMQNMQRFQPEMQEIRRKYKNDRQRQNEELMKLFRENKINPASSCLPLLLQFPVFIALFFVLRGFEDEVFPAYRAKGETVEDLHWLNVVPNITDAAASHWSGFLLIAIYAVSQLASTYFMSTTMQGAQRAVLFVLPIVFIPFIINFPAGLVIYWVTTNLWTVGQGIVTRRLTPKPAPPPKRTSRTPPKSEQEGDGRDGAKADAREERTPSAPPKRVRRKKRARR